MSPTPLLTLSSTPDGIIQAALLADGSTALRWLDEPNGAWVHFGDLQCAAPPAALIEADGTLWLFARNGSGDVFARVRRGSAPWSTWQSIGGRLTDGPTACLDASGRVVVLGGASDGAVWHAFHERGQWSGWSSLGGGTKHAPVGITSADGRLHVFAVGTDDALWCRYYAGGWSSWVSLGGALTSGPAVVNDGTGTLCLFGRGADGAPSTSHYDRGWTPWTSIGGGMAGGLAAAIDRRGRKVLRYVGRDGDTLMERVGIDLWSREDAVDRVSSWPNVAQWRAEQEARSAALVQDSLVQRTISATGDVVRIMIARGIRAGLANQTMAGLEGAFAGCVRRMSDAKQGVVSALAEAELRRLDQLRAAEPDVWRVLDTHSSTPLMDQLSVLARGTQLDGDEGGSNWSGFEPQERGVAKIRIHRIICEEETDEGGKDTITLAGFKQAPMGKPEPIGPFDLGDFWTGRNEPYGETDERMNHRWLTVSHGVSNDYHAYELQVFLTEVDDDLDPEVLQTMSIVINLAASVVGQVVVGSVTGGLGVALGALVTEAIRWIWQGISTWWKDATKDEIGPLHRLHVYAGKPDANVVLEARMHWDDGRYLIHWSGEPGEPFDFLENLPPAQPDREKQFELLDVGPFTQIGVAGLGSRFGLWARRRDGRVLFRATPEGPWAELGGEVTRLDDGWALIGSAAARFEWDTQQFVTRTSRRSGEQLPLAFEFVAGSIEGPAWALAGRHPYRLSSSGGSGGMVAQLPVWEWSLVPTEPELRALYLADTPQGQRVWGIGTNGVPYEQTTGFVPRPASFEVASMCISTDEPPFAVSAKGATYRFEAGSWAPYACIDPARTPLSVKQLCHVGKVGSTLHRYYLLTSQGQLYVAKGPTVL